MNRIRSSRYKIVLVLLLMLVLLGGSVGSFAADPLEYTIAVVNKAYQPAKYEPIRGTYVGAYVLQDPNSVGDEATFNMLTKKTHAAFFKYVGFGKAFPKEWVDNLKRNGAAAHIAWEPNRGLDEVTEEYVTSFAVAAGKAGVPIFLRYASEMNGEWVKYSGDPEKYIEKWRLVHDIMEKEAPNVVMVWNVFAFPEKTMMKYYPGDAYVDWVGVNVYNVVFHNNNKGLNAKSEDPFKLMDYVYRTFSYRKPIMIGEYGVTHFTSTDGKDYTNFAISKLKKLYSEIPTRYPRIKAIYYYNASNLNSYLVDRRINDFSLTSSAKKFDTYTKLVSNGHYLSSVSQSSGSGDTRSEMLTYSNSLFVSKGVLHVDVEFFTNYLNMDTVVDGKTVYMSDGSLSKTYQYVPKYVLSGVAGQKRYVKGIPLGDVASTFGYKIIKDNNMIYMLKRY